MIAKEENQFTQVIPKILL